MKKGRLKEIVKELQKASKMHLKQSEEIAGHIDDMKSPANKLSDEGKKMTRSKDPKVIKTKDSLHNVARKLNKPFYSEEHKVNVDIEDGVLSNTPKSGNYPKA